MGTQPHALRLAEKLDSDTSGSFAVAGAAAELRRLHSVNAELLAALNALYCAAPTSTNCNDFHHSAGERHAFGAECKPVADYLAALAAARAAIALATPAPSTQEGK